jgi:hypothetical protein
MRRRVRKRKDERRGTTREEKNENEKRCEKELK